MAFEKFRSVSDKEWLDILIRSIDEPLIDGVEISSLS